MYPTITVLGAGYVGLTTAVLLANAGFTVYLLEPNEARRTTIQAGKSFFYEHGLDTLLQRALKKKALFVTDSYAEAVTASEIIFSCVGTPDNPDGSSNLQFVFSAVRAALAHAQPGTIYVQKSTVPVGTGVKICTLFANECPEKNIRYVSNPEFLREGTAVSDTLFFDRVVAGSHDTDAAKQVLGIYRRLEENREAIAHVANIPLASSEGDYIATSLNSAELIKVTANAFLALKISFANSIALLADKADADIVEVMDAVGADRRIGKAFLQAGRGYGGGCFPKDVSGLIASALEYGVDLNIMEAAQEQNRIMPGYIVERVQHAVGASLANKRVAVLGLAFKPGTSDVRKSPGVAIANTLHKAGANVKVYDPEAMDEALGDLYRDVQTAPSIEAAIKDTDALILATEWPAFIKFPAATYAQLLSGRIFFDAVNCYDQTEAQRHGLTYIGVGRAAASTTTKA